MDIINYVRIYHPECIFASGNVFTFDLLQAFRDKIIYRGELFFTAIVYDLGDPLFADKTLDIKYRDNDLRVLGREAFAKLYYSKGQVRFPFRFRQINWKYEKVLIFRNSYI